MNLKKKLTQQIWENKFSIAYLGVRARASRGTPCQTAAQSDADSCPLSAIIFSEILAQIIFMCYNKKKN